MDIIDKIHTGKIKGYLTVNTRIIFEGGIYHITQRAPGRELLFLEEGDNLYFLKILKDTAKKFNLELFCFSLLPNHVHLLLKINHKNLSSAMKNLFERYADYFNKKYKRKGHVFCGRYRASLCNDEKYLLAASLYIHLNPYKAGLCKDVKLYRWSSIALYANENKKSFINNTYILNLLDAELREAQKKYMAILEDGKNVKEERITLGAKAIKVFLHAIIKVIKKNNGADNSVETVELDKMIENFRSKKRIIAAEDGQARRYLVQQLLANGFSHQDVMRELSIGRATFYRIYRQIKSRQAPANDTKQVRPK